MDDEFRVARRYLAPPAQSFWLWSRDGEALEWASGETIAFSAEVQHMLERLAPQGLPPLNAVVLLLAACRDTWPQMSEQFVDQCNTLVHVERRFLPDWVASVIEGLDQVNRLDVKLRRSLEAKAQLAEIVFEYTTQRTLPTDAATIARVLDGRPPREILSRRAALVDSDSLLKTLRCLQPGLARVDEESLRLLTRTGLEQLVAPAEIELWPADRMRRLIGELIEDEELGGIARLARNLMAAINLPRPLADPDDLPAGGVSDISNRGNLDRLLISELAHDDLTLAVRVATNEALYLRRETPPRQPPRRRAVLIDSGIRMWGVPRVFAAAVAMALTAKADREGDVDVFRADGAGLAPVDLTTREGLVKHLEALSPDPHPALATKRFLDELSTAQDVSDAVVITCDEVLNDGEFREELATVEADSYFLATVGCDGQFALSLRTSAGRKSVCQAHLELNEMLAPVKTSARPLIDDQRDPSLPLIFGVCPFPLLLPHVVNFERAWHVEDFGALAITSDRRLMHWSRAGQGARELADDMPRGKVLWASSSPLDGRAYACVGHEASTELYVVEVDLARLQSRVTRLDLSEPVRAVSAHSGMLFAIHKQRVVPFSLATGVSGKPLALPNRTSWVHDRFFRGPAGWHAMSSDGTNTHLELVISSKDVRAHAPSTMFDVEGIEGPVGLSAQGGLINTADATIKSPHHGLTSDVRILAISRNGKRVLLRGESKDRTYATWQIIDTANGRARTAYGNARQCVEQDITNVVRPRTLRVHFRGIYADGSSIVLVSRNGTHLRFECDRSDQPTLQLASTPPKGFPIVPFENMPRLSDGGYHLRVAQWSDGSRAFLDSRGLLHLKSSSVNVPDMTLVLYEGETACWTSRGELVGADYFTGGKSNGDMVSIYSEVNPQFACLLP
jgi:hypothetical protein